MHFFAGVGSLFAGIGMTLLLALTVLTLLRIDIPSLSLWLSAGFGILIGILLGAIELLCELYVSLLNSEKNNEAFRQYFGILIAGLLLFFLIKPFVQTHASVKTVTFQVQWQRLIFSFLLILFYSSVYLYPFATLLSGITQKQVPFRSAWTLFHLANITRYLRGRIWGLSGFFP